MHAEIKRQLEENGELKSRMFCIDNLFGDESISFYTGFPNWQTFQASLVYLNPATGVRPTKRSRHIITMGTIRKTNLGEREL